MRFPYLAEVLYRLQSRNRYRLVSSTMLGITAGEVYLTRLLKGLRTDFVLDVGANAGQYGQQLRRMINYRGKIHSLEPDPGVFVNLRARTTRDPTWTIECAALGEESGRARFNITQNSQFNSLLPPSMHAPSGLAGQQQVITHQEINVITLDQWMWRNQVIPTSCAPLLKLDTQGTELSVLKGGVASLASFAAIQTEVAFHSLYEGGATFTDVDAFLTAQGFLLSGMFPNNKGHYPRLLEADAVYLNGGYLSEISS